MSVIGVGIDLVDVAGFAEQLAAPGTRFELHAFSAGERAEVGATASDRTRRLAARFAAKEAFIKAWSASRFGRAPAMANWALSEVEVVTDAHGRPSLRLSGAVAAAVHQQLGDRWTAHVSMTHDGPSAAAVVVLEGPPDAAVDVVKAAVDDARDAADEDGPVGTGLRSDGPRGDGPRSDGPRSDGPRSDGQGEQQ